MRLRHPLFAAALLLLPAAAHAQEYPARSVTIVAPAAPGGLYSLFARLIGTKLEQRFGKPFVVENRPGASSIVGIMSVIRSEADGHTLMIANNTGMAVNVTMNKSLPYDPRTDLVPVALIARIPEVLVVNAALPIRSVADIAAYSKTAGRLSYGSPGAGTGPHLSGVQLAAALGIEMTHVPYKGVQPAINDVAGGHVPMMFSPIPFAVPPTQAGKLRMLGVNAPQRVDAIPDVPPLADSGLKGLDAGAWFMLVAPGKTPPDIVARLHREVLTMTSDPAVRQEFTRLGLVPVASAPPDELKRFITNEIALWAAIVKRAGLTGAE